MDYSHTIAEITYRIETLLEESGFVKELAGEDEGFLETIVDFFARIEEQFTARVYVEEDPILWREQQDAETD